MNSRNIHCPDSKENQKWLSHADKYVCLDGFCSLTHILGHLNKGDWKKKNLKQQKRALLISITERSEHAGTLWLENMCVISTVPKLGFRNWSNRNKEDCFSMNNKFVYDQCHSMLIWPYTLKSFPFFKWKLCHPWAHVNRLKSHTLFFCLFWRIISGSYPELGNDDSAEWIHYQEWIAARKTFKNCPFQNCHTLLCQH